jgi:hypothetical protein
MMLTFENHYVVAVLIFMVSMLFCKNLLECIQACIQVSQSLFCKELLFCPCVYQSHAELLRESVLKVLLVFSIFQPLVLLLVKKISEAFSEQKSFWTVNVGYVVINADAFTHSKNETPVFLTPEPGVVFSVSEIDVVLVVMPFTLAAASTTWTWVSLQHQEFFKADPDWGPELFSDPRMLLYELLYCFEVFALLCALLSLSADPVPLEYTLVTALLLSFLVLFFCAQSHQQRIADQAEHTISMIVFSILSSLVSFFVVQHWTGGCPTKRISGLLLVVVVLMLAILHMSTREDTTAGTVILLRTVVSSSCSLYFVVLAAQDPNSWCLDAALLAKLPVHQR